MTCSPAPEMGTAIRIMLQLKHVVASFSCFLKWANRLLLLVEPMANCRCTDSKYWSGETARVRVATFPYSKKVLSWIKSHHLKITIDPIR